jgi:hypothetical protein
MRPGPGRPNHLSYISLLTKLRHFEQSLTHIAAGPAQIEFGLNLIVCCELERDTQTANFALLQINWCGRTPCLRRLLLLVCCSVAFDAIEV